MQAKVLSEIDHEIEEFASTILEAEADKEIVDQPETKMKVKIYGEK